MRENNPFVLTFGLKPNNYISRIKQSEEVISAFKAKTNNVYMITGVRGSGKTVMLSHISDHFNDLKDWVVVELISESDMVDQLASLLYDSSLFHRIIDRKSFGFSFSGLSFSVSGEKPVTNAISFLEILLDKFKRKNKKILICVDEAVNNSFMKPFTQTMQLLLRKNYDVFLLMTGLYQNIYDLQNNSTLTFLYRAPKINLEPLNIGAIADSYQEIFALKKEEAIEFAKLTKGYAYAYQVLGHLLWEKGEATIDNALLTKLDQYLQEYVYDKIWSELSGNDKLVLLSFLNQDNESVENLLKITGMNKKEFSVYRDRLIKRGLLSAPEYGKLVLRLPRFLEFLNLCR